MSWLYWGSTQAFIHTDREFYSRRVVDVTAKSRTPSSIYDLGPAMRTSNDHDRDLRLHKLLYLTPEDAQPFIGHNSSPRSDEGVRESVVRFTPLLSHILV